MERTAYYLPIEKMQVDLLKKKIQGYRDVVSLAKWEKNASLGNFVDVEFGGISLR